MLTVFEKPKRNLQECQFLAYYFENFKDFKQMVKDNIEGNENDMMIQICFKLKSEFHNKNTILFRSGTLYI